MNEIRADKFSWIDLKQPNADDVLLVQKRFKLHPLVVEEFFTPTLRPKASEYDTCMYLAIHIPLFNAHSKTTQPGELDIVITESALITSHDQEILQLSDFFNEIKRSRKKRNRHMHQSPASLLRYILEMLFESCFPKLDHISRRLDYIEKEIFDGHEKDMVREISLIKRDILNFRRTMKPQRSVLESIAQRDYRFIESELKAYFQDLIGTNIRIWNALESTKETIESLEATNNSLLSNKLNLTMKVLTLFSAVMLPMTVYSNILAMSADIPFGRNPYGFWIHIFIMLFLSFLTISVFKFKKWL